MRNALDAVITLSLGLSSTELAEVGGFTERFARDLLAGRRPFPSDVAEAVRLIQDDIDVMADAFVSDIEEGQAAIMIHPTNSRLREARPDIPGRGAAGGGFVGPYRIAALTAFEIMQDRGVDIDLLFPERKQKHQAPL